VQDNREEFSDSPQELAKSFCENANGHGNTAAIFSSVLEFDGMTREDAANYAQALGQTINDLRSRNVHIIWACINSEMGNKSFCPEADAASDVRSLEELTENGFLWEEDEYDNYDILLKFIDEYGPRENEAMFRKSFMSALVEPGDIEHENRQEHQYSLLEQAGIIVSDGSSPAPAGDMFRVIDPVDADEEYLGLFNNDVTVAEYLRDNNIQRTLIMGQVAYYCNLETCISAAEKGFNPSIVGDRCLSWVYTEDADTGSEVQTCVWNSDVDRNGNKFAESVDHQGRMQNRLDEIVSGESHIRNLSDEDRHAIESIPIICSADIHTHLMKEELEGLAEISSSQHQEIPALEIQAKHLT
jgi:nicotinamidase-related amidase